MDNDWDVEDAEAWRCHWGAACLRGDECRFGPLEVFVAAHPHLDPRPFMWMGRAVGRGDLGVYKHGDTRRPLVLNVAGTPFDATLVQMVDPTDVGARAETYYRWEPADPDLMIRRALGQVV